MRVSMSWWRAIELSVSEGDDEAVRTLSTDVDGLSPRWNPLRQALEET
jgi:hypothetical protein